MKRPSSSKYFPVTAVATTATVVEDTLWLLLAAATAIRRDGVGGDGRFSCWTSFATTMTLVQSVWCWVVVHVVVQGSSLVPSSLASPTPPPPTTTTITTIRPPSGLQMGMVMVPTLWHVMDNNIMMATTPSSFWHTYSLVAPALAVISTGISRHTSIPGLTIVTIAMFVIALWDWNNDQHEDDNDNANNVIETTPTTTTMVVILIMFGTFWILNFALERTPAVARSLTHGEQKSMGLLLVVVLTEWIFIIINIVTTMTTDDDNDDVIYSPWSLHVLVALTGSVGCGLTATSTSIINRLLLQRSRQGRHAQELRRFSWPARLPLNVAGPLAAVEGLLYLFSPKIVEGSSLSTTITTQTIEWLPSFLPRSLTWLCHFLLEPETGSLSSTIGYPRHWALLYWVVVLIICSGPTLYLESLRNPALKTTSGPSSSRHGDQVSSPRPPQKQTVSVTVARKWFHLVAVLLFVPVTWVMPQLMSLAYAIAVCVLVVVETVRSDIPPIQHFYKAFVDGDTKKEAKGTGKENRNNDDEDETMIVSHIFLILGCAAPLWLSSAVCFDDESAASQRQPLIRLLSLFGVLSIGIGDAMGAVVGNTMGRHKWGVNQRTVEGSLAMWTSMMVPGMAILLWSTSDVSSETSVRDVLAVLVATTFTTLMEAFTEQLDNLALPLAGSSILLMFLSTPVAA